MSAEALLAVIAATLATAGLFGAIALIWTLVHGRRVRQLGELAAQLEGGALTGAEGSMGLIKDMRVTGRRDGHAVTLRFEERRGHKNHYSVGILEVAAPHAAGGFVIQELSAIDRMDRRLGLVTPRQGVHPDLAGEAEVTGGDAGAFRSEEARAALRQLLAAPRVSGVRLVRETLDVELQLNPGVLEPARLLAAIDGLVAVARAIERRPAVRLTDPAKLPRFTWTGGGASRCPFCKDDLAPDRPDAGACDACGTLHHTDCLREGGGCAVFGCGGAMRAEVRV